MITFLSDADVGYCDVVQKVYIFFVSELSKIAEFHVAVHEIRKKFGDIMTLYLGMYVFFNMCYYAYALNLHT